ncbi:hypothetical protein NMU03_01570 [Allocoprobacillus halotolerans]|uniref:DUF1700 domain-containing protein n=1 Tax=Allocoprobacillus halotolerans TaxID=2944914 RepID=A0ABY5I2F7_9FIRM|nr:hypothetical protein [Allocoprobacillus halotolerans]UTY39552.1 hypothetical protein NMU03_01570 [Allocoprobacillus halotolerans]
MVDLKDIMDFKDQHIVDELYKRLKDIGEFNDLEDIYLEITNRNKTKIQTFQYHYEEIIQKITKVLSASGWILFSFLFIISGSFICATLIGYIFAMNDSFKNIYQFFSDLGLSFLKTFFSFSIENIDFSDRSTPLMFCILGLTIILVLFFVLLYLWNILKKEKRKKFIYRLL